MTNLAADMDLLPAWTKHVTTDLGGRDPLGLSRVAHMIADKLMPGIVTQTDRARYYAIYCWILWHIHEEEPPKALADFDEAFQRREAAIALATLLEDEESSPVGKRVVSSRLHEARKRGSVSTAFRVLPSNRFGGYGQYYTGCLYALGLTWRMEDGYDQVSPTGEELARAVHASIATTPYITRRLYMASSVMLDDLERSAHRLSIDAISQPFAKDERESLISLFFALRGDDTNGGTISRPQSLVHMLALIEAYEHAGIPVLERMLDEQLLYGPAYFGVLVSEDGTNVTASCPPELQRCRSFWRQFCLHQYLTQSIEWLLVAVLRVVETNAQGYAVNDILAQLLKGDFQHYLEDALPQSSAAPRSLMTQLGASPLPDRTSARRGRQRRPYEHHLSEASLAERGAESPAELAAWSCLLLAVLYDHWFGATTDPEFFMVMDSAGTNLAAANVLQLLSGWFSDAMTWNVALRELIQTLVINQHDRVMYEKGRLESCWLHMEDGRVVHDQDYSPYFRTPRHEQAVQIFIDLDLLRRDGECLALNAAGRTILRRVLGVRS